MLKSLQIHQTLYSFGENDTLEIAKGSYTTVKSGSDMLVKVGNGSVTLKDVSSATINLITNPNWTIKGTTAKKTFAEKSNRHDKFKHYQK